MAWVFDSIVDSGRDRDQSSGRKVFYARLLFKDGVAEQCQTVFFYDVAPTVAQRNAARDRVSDQLNAPPTPREIFDDIKDDLQELVRQYAKDTGKTKAQIFSALKQALT